MPWSGEWPGWAECREYGFFARWRDGGGWVPCRGDHPEAIGDLNTLLSLARWDGERKRFVYDEAVLQAPEVPPRHA